MSMESASNKYASRLCCTTLLHYFTTILYYTRLQSAPMDVSRLYFTFCFHFATLLCYTTLLHQVVELAVCADGRVAPAASVHCAVRADLHVRPCMCVCVCVCVCV